MATLTPRSIDRERLQRLDTLIRAVALPCLGTFEMTLPADHPLYVDPGLHAGALAGQVPILRIDSTTRPDVAALARLLRGARPAGISRLWWLTSGASSSDGPTGRAILSVCALGRPAVRFRVSLPLPLALPALHLMARSGVVLLDPTDPATAPDPNRPTIALAPTTDARTALRVLEEWSM